MVPLRVFNASDEVYNLVAETVVALAKPGIDVTLLELFEEHYESIVDQARVICQHVPQETFERTLPESLQELLGRSPGYLADSETERLRELLCSPFPTETWAPHIWFSTELNQAMPPPPNPTTASTHLSMET